MVQRREIPHFYFIFENRRQRGLAARDLTEKLVKTGGTPFLSHFVHFGPKWPKTVNSWPPIGVQGVEEKCNLLMGGELRDHLEGVFGP